MQFLIMFKLVFKCLNLKIVTHPAEKETIFALQQNVFNTIFALHQNVFNTIFALHQNVFDMIFALHKIVPHTMLLKTPSNLK